MIYYEYILLVWLLSISDKTSYRNILQSLEAAKFVFRIARSIWNLTGTSAAVPVKFQSDTNILILDLAHSRLHEISR